jgi:hypothetical protein
LKINDHLRNIAFLVLFDERGQASGSLKKAQTLRTKCGGSAIFEAFSDVEQRMAR